MKSAIIPLVCILFISTAAIAQERSKNPGEDPNEAMTADGAGVPNYGCPDPSKACYKNLKHTRLQDQTNYKASSAAGKKSQPGTDSSEKGTR